MGFHQNYICYCYAKVGPCHCISPQNGLCFDDTSIMQRLESKGLGLKVPAMLRAGAHTGPSAVLLVEDIPASELNKPELVMSMLMRQAGPLKAYTFFPGPAAAAAAEFDRPDVAKQVMRRSRALNLSGPPAEQICGMRKGATMEGTLIMLASQDKASPAVMPRAVTALFRSFTAAQHAQRCACVLCAGVQAVRRVCDGAPAAARRLPAALSYC